MTYPVWSFYAWMWSSFSVLSCRNQLDCRNHSRSIHLHLAIVGSRENQMPILCVLQDIQSRNGLQVRWSIKNTGRMHLGRCLSQKLLQVCNYKWLQITDLVDKLWDFYMCTGAHIKTHKLLQVCKQVVTNLCTSCTCRQVVFALFVPMCCNKFGTSC
jgi:hypothetical protein